MSFAEYAFNEHDPIARSQVTALDHSREELIFEKSFRFTDSESEDERLAQPKSEVAKSRKQVSFRAFLEKSLCIAYVFQMLILK